MTLRRSTVVVLVIAALVLPSAVVLGQSKDPFIGTWVVDRSKSDFDPPTPFQKRTLIIQEAEGGLTFTTRTISDRLAVSETSYTGRADGTDLPIEGSALDAVSLRRLNATTLERTGKLRGNAVETATMKLSADGKMLTLTSKGAIDGRTHSSSQVFYRQ